MTILTDRDEAIRLIDSFEGEPEEFLLAISERLLDPVGINMALITDRVLNRGWDLDGYEQRAGYRIYRYKRME